MRPPLGAAAPPARPGVLNAGRRRPEPTLEESRTRLTEILARLALRRQQFDDLEKETHASKWRVRSRALKRLVHYPPSWLLPVLCRRLDDRSKVVRTLALTHLYRILMSRSDLRSSGLPEEALPRLIRCLREMQLAERTLAAELLKEYGGIAASGAITEALDRELRRRPIGSLIALIAVGAVFYILFFLCLGGWPVGLVPTGAVAFMLVIRLTSDERLRRRAYLDLLIETLMEINRSHTHRELRDALPVLKRLIRNPADNGVQLSRKGREAIRQIETATQTVRSLPIAHEGDHTSTHDLPRAVDGAPSAAAAKSIRPRRRRRRL